MGALLCQLMDCFDVDSSLNSFYTTKIGAHMMEFFPTWFLVTPTTCLGLGAYANSQGGENKNKFAKQASKTWTNGHEGSFKDLLDQMVEIFIYAPSIFTGLIPAYIDLYESIFMVFGTQTSVQTQMCFATHAEKTAGKMSCPAWLLLAAHHSHVKMQSFTCRDCGLICGVRNLQDHL